MVERIRPRRLFWRLLVPQVLLVAVGAVFAAAVALQSAAPEHWGRWLPWIGLEVLVGCTVAAGFSAVLARQLAGTFHQVAAALDQLEAGQPEPMDLTDSLEEEASPISRSLRYLGRRLAHRVEQLEEDRQQLRTILSGMVEGVVALDPEQRILYANDRAAELLELPSQLPVGRRFWEVVRQRPLLDVVRQALDQAEPTRDEIVWNGAGRSLTVHAARLPGALPRGAVLVVHDTTELRRLERLRQDFAANASHELKTPLSVIKACVETLLDGAVDDPEHRGPFLERIAQQSDRLHSLILDLLSLARVESGNELFDFQAVPVGPVVGACLERFHARADARRQQLTAHNADEPVANPATVWADGEALEQILDNLVDNALKYTPENGQVRISWRVEGEQVQLEVADTGVGIPEHDLPRIFERFYRVDKARARALGGTGLGLSIVKHLVQAMHGSVQATSHVGQGTTFAITLPRAGAA